MVEISSNKYIEVAIYITILFVSLICFLVLLVYYNLKNKLKHQKQLMETMVETQEKERLNIAKDIHDEFSNIYSSIALEISAIETSNDNKEQLDESLFHLRRNLELAKQQMRFNVRNLAPGNLINHHWISELEFLKSYVERHHVTLNLNISSAIPNIQLTTIQHTNLFRICQELVNNALKHSKSKDIGFIIDIIKGDLVVVYHDNGIGFDYESALLKNSFGLKSIKARTELLEGTCECNSEENEGTTWKFNFKMINI